MPNNLPCSKGFLPCPFCGSLELEGPHRSEQHVYGYCFPSYWIECKNCPAEMTIQDDTVDELKLRWNSRAT